MRRRTDDTVRQLPAPVVVVVGGSDALVQACHEVVRRGVPARVEPCDLANVTTVVARWKPYAIVVPDTLLEFDAQEFQALARDVRAQIVRAPEDGHVQYRLAELLLPHLKRAFEERSL
jgi:hypothetical protein